MLFFVFFFVATVMRTMSKSTTSRAVSGITLALLPHIQAAASSSDSNFQMTSICYSLWDGCLLNLVHSHVKVSNAVKGSLRSCVWPQSTAVQEGLLSAGVCLPDACIGEFRASQHCADIQANHMYSASSDFSSGNIAIMGWLLFCKTEGVISFLRLKRSKKRKISKIVFLSEAVYFYYVFKMRTFDPMKICKTEFYRKNPNN